MDKQTNYLIKPQSETSVVIYFGDSISEAILKQITGLNTSLRLSPFDGFIESVPAYISLTVIYDPAKVLSAVNLKGDYAFERVINYLKHLPVSGFQEICAISPEPLVIPVCYGGEFGPDIEEVAKHNNITIDELIHLHSASVYTVYMLGFMPGFPYLGGMNKLLATPRLNSPRKKVPAGTVGIAGEQTGIYPLQSPGGWQLIGRTPLKLFDPHHSSPTLLHAGDRLTFSVISKSQFLELSN